MSQLKSLRIIGRHRGDLSLEAHLDLQKDWNRIPDLELANTKVGRDNSVKKGIADGISFDSKWEYCFYIYMTRIIGHPLQRNREVKLKYYDVDGKQRTWIPDFVGQKIYEVKGRETATDRCKRDQHPEVEWYDFERMKPIIRIVTRKYPTWKTDYIEKT